MSGSVSGHRARQGILAAALFTCVALTSGAAASAAASCDSACLTHLATQYVDALATEHWRDLPWADTVHYAENSVKMMVGDGTWATATAHSAMPLIVPDPVTGKVVWMGTVDEHGQPGFYALELTAKGDRIGAVQSVIRRKEGRPPFGDPLNFMPAALLSASQAPRHATARKAMISLANSYFAAQSDSKGRVPVAFANGCERIENGVPMMGNLPAVKGETGDCAKAFHLGLFQEYEGVRHRIAAVDPARGLLVAVGYRDMPAAKVSFEAKDGTSYAAEAQYPRSVGFITVFRIDHDAIVQVVTVASELPYMMPFPW